MSLLSQSANCIRNVLMVFDLIFMITGIILIGVGVGVATVFREYDLFLTQKFFSISTFLIVIGSFIIIFTIFGCWGALKENYCLILIFSILLGLIFILELAAGISGYVLKSETEKLIKGTLNESMTHYDSKKVTSVTILWDSVQRDFSCCGVENYTDWSNLLSGQLPLSCCKIPNGIIGNFSCTTSIADANRNTAGCLTEFSEFIKVHAVSLGAAGIVIAVLQFFGVLFACYIAREIKIRNGITGLTG